MGWGVQSISNNPHWESQISLAPNTTNFKLFNDIFQTMPEYPYWYNLHPWHYENLRWAMSKYPDWEPLPQHPALRLVFVDQPPNNAITISSFQVNNRINSGNSNVTRTIFSLKSTIDLKKWENTAFTSKGQERGIKLCHKWPCPSVLHKSARKESRKCILL